MPLVFSREEVREYLSEMGYGELSDDDLDKFIKDLRKLIKKESRERRRRRLGHTGLTHSDLSTTADGSSARETTGAEDTSQSIESDDQPRLLRTPKSKQKRHRPRRVEISSDFSTPHDTTSGTSMSATTTSNGETSSSATTSTKNSTTSSAPGTADVLRQRDFNRQQPEVPDSAKRTKRPPARAAERQESGPEEDNENLQFESEQSSSSSSSGETDLSDTDLLYLMEHILRADLSETTSQAETNKRRYDIPPKIRRDPVALYHWYKTFWEKQKAPGEDRHMQLRWNVRAGTLGRYPCDADGHPIQYLPLNPVKTRRKIQGF